MPLYEYIPDGESCPTCLGGFEVLQKPSDPPLSRCPDCGNPCHQVLSAFQVGGSPKTDLSPKNLERKGFTQYVRRGKGCYEKTAGKGPQTIVNSSS